MKKQWRRMKLLGSGKIWKRLFTKHNDRPIKTAMALSLGVFIGILPIWGGQLISGVVSAHLLKLNKPLVLLATNIHFTPIFPIIAFFALKIGFMVTGNELAFPSMGEINLVLLKDYFWFYVIGSLPIALITASFTGLITYFSVYSLRYLRQKE
ncbi:MAG TPA: hypothetical protein DCQ26_09305 [Marinilabiliales bacterium]|jgi:uncharacterized protein (DUF2062 family)|nr:MAG: hypothetical protein A2W95_09820 [Bacteroidetes bacterium GWA2_40_14]OFX65144.1 MAG: hypothetical protein A2W84_16810 [Bacteroidetes bacterium GWC2_40_13]OFX74320.1 MAG: hypothetical protein A2W96_13425 [Bacteroidetes bacterium GWD2_40_43]OFX90945.1 MAG: hypothetical protein A2W97_07935 [Bacteroidetes bacterium GWE2_40_63]OFY21159.1 MAG: hypothetical protein A2W88_18910 [Bacteroidetes bacterium GWF2_40_13]OFZ25363.1 MAG: hypothetical protein A2437_01390 [Bacteroidetes bacterium RIFOXYC